MRKILSLFALLFYLTSHAQTDSTTLSKKEKLSNIFSKFDISGYGVVNYYNFDWETLPDKRDAVDPERFNLYLKYHFNSFIELKTEIEFEHGGVGAAMEFDPLEEFGEYDESISKGGEVILEQINLLFKIKSYFNIRMGKMRIYMGNAADLDRPINYFTAYRPEVENTILPLGWYETGLELSGTIPLSKEKQFPAFQYKAYLVTGLDNSGFSSLNFIRKGYQKRFEMINADNLAYILRLDLVFKEKSYFGFNYYAGNGTGNRPKKDYTLASWLHLADLHFNYKSDHWRLSAYALLAHLQNSEALSAANRNLSNNLDVKRTPVAKMAAGAYIEGGYNLLHLAKKDMKHKLFLFGRAEWYDSMFRTAGQVTDNPRYSRQVYTLGFNYFPIKEIVIKTHYAYRLLGTKETEKTFSLGFGFSF